MTKLSQVSRDSSTSFEDNEDTRVRKFAKHMLRSFLFVGTFMEKRLVEPLNSYRDVIKVADEETDLIENLRAVRKRCSKYFSRDLWIGITEPTTVGAPAGYNLWVTLDEEVFGSYWYKIKNVEFYFNEIRIKLEVVRPVCREKTPLHSQEVLDDLSNTNLKGLGIKIKNIMFKNVNELFSETLTWANIKHTSIFLFLLVSTLITLVIQAVHYLLEYFLKLLHETSGLIKVCSPIIISFMKLIMNTINGLYALIAVMWRSRSPSNVQNILQISPYDAPNYNLRMLPSPYQRENFARNHRPYRSSLKITPLD